MQPDLDGVVGFLQFWRGMEDGPTARRLEYQRLRPPRAWHELKPGLFNMPMLHDVAMLPPSKPRCIRPPVQAIFSGLALC